MDKEQKIAELTRQLSPVPEISDRIEQAVRKLANRCGGCNVKLEGTYTHESWCTVRTRTDMKAYLENAATNAQRIVSSSRSDNVDSLTLHNNIDDLYAIIASLSHSVRRFDEQLERDRDCGLKVYGNNKYIEGMITAINEFVED